MAIVSLERYQTSVPEIAFGNNGQLSRRSHEGRCVGNFEGHSLTYYGLEFHSAKNRRFPMWRWNVQTHVMDVKIENTLAYSFAEWNKDLVKLAVKQAWQNAQSQDAQSNDAPKTVRNLRDSEIERLASKILPAMKRGFGVDKVTQEVRAPVPSGLMGLLGMTPAAKKSVCITIESDNGHVYDLSRSEVARQVRQQLQYNKCSYSIKSVNKVVNALYQESYSSAAQDNKYKDFGLVSVYAKDYSERDIVKNSCGFATNWQPIIIINSKIDIYPTEKLQNLIEADEVLTFDQYNIDALNDFLNEEDDLYAFANELDMDALSNKNDKADLDAQYIYDDTQAEKTDHDLYVIGVHAEIDAKELRSISQSDEFEFDDVTLSNSYDNIRHQYNSMNEAEKIEEKQKQIEFDQISRYSSISLDKNLGDVDVGSRKFTFGNVTNYTLESLDL